LLADVVNAELEDRNYYREVNVFWVPHGPKMSARWEPLRAAAKQPDIGKRIDDALSLIEAENPKLKGILDKRFARAELPGGKLGDVAIFGREANPTTWRLAAMNLAIRGIDFNLGREPADTFTRDQFPDLRADFILANPPFNISDWWHASLTGDARWHYGDPPQGNANHAWLQHMLHHLKPGGRAGIVLANGSTRSSQNFEGQIRAAMVDADVLEVMVALPGQLFFNTQIPACLWFLAKGTAGKRSRAGEVPFIDARKLAVMISRVPCELTDVVIDRIGGTVAAWRGEALPVRPELVEGPPYQDIPGYCRSVKLAEIAEHGHVLVTFTDEAVRSDTALNGVALSEPALAQDWPRDDEEAAWAHLQPGK